VKIAFICDTHFGVRNDSPFFLDNALTFFEKQFFPYLEEHNITNVIHLGDFFDRRKFVNFNTLSSVRKRILNVFDEKKINLHVTIGNHDTYFRNTNELNSLKELVTGRYDTIKIHEKATTLNFDDPFKQCVVVNPGNGIVSKYRAKTEKPFFFRYTADNTYYIWAEPGLSTLTSGFCNITSPANPDKNYNTYSNAVYLGTIKVSSGATYTNIQIVNSIVLEERRNHINESTAYNYNKI
jgi:predicted phosphodiesterase